MKITHGGLLRLGHKFGYQLTDGGLCEGFSVKWALAVLVDDSVSFYAKLNLIGIYRNNLDQLKQVIDHIKLKGQILKNLSEEEQRLLDILALYDGIELALIPKEHEDFFGGKFVIQGDINTIYPLIKPINLHVKKIFTLSDKEYLFDRATLEAYLTDLSLILSETKSAIPILLRNGSHTISLKYNSEMGCWEYVDTNDFKRYEKEKDYCRLLDTKALTKSIFKSCFDDQNEYTVFNMTLLTIAQEASLEEKIKQLELKYPIKAEQAALYNSDQTGLLYLACQHGHYETAEQLLVYGAQVNHVKISNGFAPLLIACSQGNQNIASLLLQYGANVNQANSNGLTPLDAACKSGCLALVKSLLEKGANVNSQSDDKYTPLHWACAYGRLLIAQELMKEKANIHQEDNNGDTPFYTACQYGHAEVAFELLDQGAELDKANNAGETPFLIACQKGHLVIVNELLRRGANINKPDENGFSPLYLACQHGHTDIVALLLEAKDLDKIDSLGPLDNTSLQVACMLVNTPEKKRLFQLLINKGASLSHKNKENKTAFDIAFEENNQVAIVELINAALSQQLTFNQFMSLDTWLNLACQWGQVDVTLSLLSQGANVNKATNKGVTPLHLACLRGQVGIVQALLNSNLVHGVDSLDENKLSPLLAACTSLETREKPELFKELLDYGASITLKTNEGFTALDIVFSQGNQAAVVEILAAAERRQVSPDSIMCSFTLKNILGWCKERKLSNAINYLEPVKQPNESVTLGKVEFLFFSNTEAKEQGNPDINPVIQPKDSK